MGCRGKGKLIPAPLYLFGGAYRDTRSLARSHFSPGYLSYLLSFGSLSVTVLGLGSGVRGLGRSWVLGQSPLAGLHRCSAWFLSSFSSLFCKGRAVAFVSWEPRLAEGSKARALNTFPQIVSLPAYTRARDRRLLRRRRRLRMGRELGKDINEIEFGEMLLLPVSC